MTTCKQMVDFLAGIDFTCGYLKENGVQTVGRGLVKDFPHALRWQKINRPRKKMCYCNAQRFVLDGDRGGCQSSPLYWEGYWDSGTGIPVYHGWATIDGVIVDHTAEAVARYCARNKIGGKRDAGREQYYGVQISTEVIMEGIADTRTWSARLPWMLLRREKLRENSQNGVVSDRNRL